MDKVVALRELTLLLNSFSWSCCAKELKICSRVACLHEYSFSGRRFCNSSMIVYSRP